MQLALFINKLGTADIIFFVVCAVIVAAIVGIYFLIPVINKKQYRERRENLEKREMALKTNRGETVKTEETLPEESAETDAAASADEIPQETTERDDGADGQAPTEETEN